MLFELYGEQEAFEYYKSVNPQFLGFNAGIQGISLDMYEDFLDPEYFKLMLNLFNYQGIYDSNGKEILGPERSAIDTQQQSFFGIMNIIRSKTKPHILNPDEYFVCTNCAVCKASCKSRSWSWVILGISIDVYKCG